MNERGCLRPTLYAMNYTEYEFHVTNLKKEKKLGI